MDSISQVPAHMNFDSLKITTITLIFRYNQPIDKLNAFRLLHTAPVSLPVGAKKKTKTYLPPGNCGDIISMVYKDETRGADIWVKRPFKNSATVCMSTRRKNIKFKLAPQTFQLTGAKCMEDGLDIAQGLIEKLNHIQSMLDKIQAKPDKGLAELRWLAYCTCESVNGQYTNETIAPNKPFPGELDADILNFLLSYREDLSLVHDYKRYIWHLMEVLNISWVISPNTYMEIIEPAMINYNYNIGFWLNRGMLAEHIDGRDGFVAEFDPLTMNHAAVWLPYVKNRKITCIKPKKTKVPRHTFLCHKFGGITQSGPDVDMMREAYKKFVGLMYELRPLIETTKADSV